ncbi:MAG: metallophosphoesterase [Lachnospiraceae bacterium]|nr:metallophosphoesterase [Lachnospiraceae bacterium]
MIRKLIPWATAAAAVAGILFFLRSEYERDQLVTEIFTIRSPKIKGNGKRLVFLTDLHDKEFGPNNERLLQAIREADPDVVLVGGDMMVAKGVGDLTLSLKFLKRLSEEFSVICANGNHEIRLRNEKETYGNKYREYRQALAEMGITVLSDRKVALDQDIELYGLNLLMDHYRKGYPRMKPGFVETVLGRPNSEKYSLLLAHSPMYFKQYAEWGADLTLSGHFHGGTIRLPLVGGVMTPQFQFFYPWCSGQYEGAYGRKMIVGRGLGTHSINIRFNDKPQVVVVDLKGEN